MIALVVGGLVALVVSRRPRRPVGRRAVAGLDALFMLPLGVSAVTVGFGFLLSMHHPFGLPVDLRTSPLLVPIAQAVVAVPLVVRTVLPVLRAIDPRLREAAATLGAVARSGCCGTVDLSIAAAVARAWPSGSRSPRRWGSSAPPRSWPGPTGRPCPS